MTACDVLLTALTAVGLFGLLTTIALVIVLLWVSRKGKGSKVGRGAG